MKKMILVVAMVSMLFAVSAFAETNPSVVFGQLVSGGLAPTGAGLADIVDGGY